MNYDVYDAAFEAAALLDLCGQKELLGEVRTMLNCVAMHLKQLFNAPQ